MKTLSSLLEARREPNPQLMHELNARLVIKLYLLNYILEQELNKDRIIIHKFVIKSMLVYVKYSASPNSFATVSD